MQTVHFGFELLFLFIVLVSLMCLVTALVIGFQKRWSAAGRMLSILGIVWAVYLGIVFLVAAAGPQRILAPHDELCYDELCFAAVNVQTAAQIGSVRANGIFYVVTVRANSHARGRAQSEKGLQARLWSPGRMYSVSPAGQRAWDAAHPEDVALTTRLRPGQSVLSDQVFDVPAEAGGLGLVLSQGFTHGYFVIGECPLFHRPTMLRLSQ